MHPVRNHPDAALTGAVFLALVVLLLRAIGDYDIWYHLAIGREIVAQGALPTTEFLMFGLADQPASFHEWGFALLFYAAKLIHVDWGPALLNALLGAATLALLLRAATTAESPAARPILILVLFAAGWVAQFRLVYRPEMLLFLALTCTILILERYRVRGRRIELAWLPLITFVLSQCHPSALFVLVVFGAYALERIIATAAAVRREEALALAGFGIAALVAAMLNPYGWEQVWLPLAFATESTYLQSVTEFLPALQTPYAPWFVATAVVTLLALGIQRPRRIAHILLCLVFGWLAWRHVRNLALFALIAYVPVALTVSTLTQRYVQRNPVRPLMWGAVVVAAISWLTISLRSGEWGAGVMPGTFPQAAADYLVAGRPPGRVFNFYDTGGYLAWRLGGHHPVFIDGRHYEVDVALQQHDAVFSAAPSWREILARHKVGAIVTPPVLRYSGALVPLVTTLAHDPQWALVAIDSGAALFVLRAFARAPLPIEHLWEQTVRDAQRIMFNFPDQTDALFALGIAYHELGQRADATATLKRYLDARPDNAAARQLLERWSLPLEK